MENKIDDQRFFTLINSFPGVVYQCSNESDWPMTFISKGSFELTGHKAEEFYGPKRVKFSDLIDPQYRQFVWDEVQKALKSRKFFQIEYKIITAEGKEKWVFEQGQGIFDDGGNFLRLEGFINDISQRKQAEQLLLESESKYSTWANSTGVGIWQINTEYITIYVNKAMCDILGVAKPEELIGKNIDSYFTESSLKLMKEEHKLRFKNVSSSYELELIRGDGEIRKVLTYGTPILDMMGNVYNYIGTFVDITAQKTINEALLKSEERFRTLFESSPMGQLISRNGQVIQVNRAFVDIFGYSNIREIAGKHVTDFIAPIQKSEVSNKIEQRSKGEIVPTSYELRAIKKGGEEFSILADLGYLELPDGNATLINIKDITESKLKEQQLQESEAKFRTLFESELMGIVTSKESGDIIEANNAFLNMLGFTREDLNNGLVNWKELTPDEYAERDLAGLKEIFETGIMRPIEKEFYRKDRSRVSVIIGASLLGTSRIGVSFIIDISELRKSQRQLETINKELNTFLYMASHDLKGPLATVIGLTQIAKNEVKDPHTLHYLDLIMKSTSKLDKSLANLMRIMKIKGGGQRTELVDFNIIIDEIKESLAEIEGYHEVKLICNIGLQSSFYSDAGILNSVLQNLVENAIKYRSHQNGPPFVEINLTELGDNIVMEVEDNGKGIDPRIKDRVFDMFYRGTSESKGSGLGLYIVKNAIEKLNGKIDVNGREGGGTRFTVVLPKTNLLEN